MASNKVISFVVRAVDEVSTTMKSMAAGVKSGVATILGNLANIKAGWDMLAGAVGKVGETMKNAFAFDDLHKKWTGLMGDADQGREHCEMLWELGETPPFSAEQFSAASQALQNFGGIALNTRENLILFGDAAAATGNSVEDVSKVLGKAYASLRDGSDVGRVASQLKEMRLITPGVADGLKQMAASGASATDMWHAIKDSLGQYNGQMDAAASSANGMVETIKGKWGTALKDFGNTFLDLAKDKMGGLIMRIDELNASGKIKEWAGKALEAIKPLVDGIENLFDGQAREITIKAAKSEFIAVFELCGDLVHAGLKSAGEWLTSKELWINAASSFWDGLKRLAGNIVGYLASAFGNIAKWLGFDSEKIDNGLDNVHQWVDDTYGTNFTGSERRRGGFAEYKDEALERYNAKIAEANAAIEKANQELHERQEAEKKAREEAKKQADEEAKKKQAAEDLVLQAAEEERRVCEQSLAELEAEYKALENDMNAAGEAAKEAAERLDEMNDVAKEANAALDSITHGRNADGSAITVGQLEADANARAAAKKAKEKEDRDAANAEARYGRVLDRYNQVSKMGLDWQKNMSLSKDEREWLSQYVDTKAARDAAAEAAAMAAQDAGVAAAKEQQAKDALAAKGIEIGEAKEQIDALNEQTGWLKKIAQNTGDMGAA